jgi:uncharacterized cysteine cluster protein YcgN (CxxCxxCC family)
MSADRPFWETVPMRQMTRQQWESLCDGCGRCCVHKLEDEETLEIFPTNVACRLLDVRTARCSNYAGRHAHVPECVRLTPERLEQIEWLPDTCGYLRIHRGQPLPDWHPLMTGDPDSARKAGQTVAGKVISETHAGDLEHHIIDTPL